MVLTKEGITKELFLMFLHSRMVIAYVASFLMICYKIFVKCVTAKNLLLYFKVLNYSIGF